LAYLDQVEAEEAINKKEKRRKTEFKGIYSDDLDVLSIDEYLA